jgi:hypothetical protein
MSSRELKSTPKDEEEKIEHVNDINKGVREEESTAPPSDIVILDDDGGDAVAEVEAILTSGAENIHQNQSNNNKKQPSIGHYYPPPSISTSPVVTGFEMKMKEHLKRGPFMSSSHSTASSSSPPVVRGSSSQPISSSHNNEREGLFDENEHQSAHSVSSSSLVVCGKFDIVFLHLHAPILCI